jgi:hypothetical protein
MEREEWACAHGPDYEHDTVTLNSGWRITRLKRRNRRCHASFKYNAEGGLESVCLFICLDATQPVSFLTTSGWFLIETFHDVSHARYVNRMLSYSRYEKSILPAVPRHLRLWRCFPSRLVAALQTHTLAQRSAIEDCYPLSTQLRCMLHRLS